MQFYGPILGGYDITENTTIGIALYELAKIEDVKLFLEVGTQVGGSARCIATGLMETSGHLHTIEAIESRVKEAQANLNGLPVTCHWSSTGSHDGLKRYYNRFSDQIKESDDLLVSLLKQHNFDAVFLDSCVETQQKELELCVGNKIKHIIMHEPDAKCPQYQTYLSSNDYEEVASGRDKIGSHNPLWVRYDHK